MPRNGNKRACAHAGCRAWAVRGGDYCVAHDPERKGLYDAAVSAGERELLQDAGRAEGLDQEIALLRVRLAWLLEHRPQDIGVQLKVVQAIVKAVAVRARLSSSTEDELYEHLLGVLRGVGGAIWPERFGEE